MAQWVDCRTRDPEPRLGHQKHFMTVFPSQKRGADKVFRFEWNMGEENVGNLKGAIGRAECGQSEGK